MKTFKKSLSLLLAICLFLTAAPLSGFLSIKLPDWSFVKFFTSSSKASEIVSNGYCGAEDDGKNLSWTLDNDGLLIISGTGTMESYNRARKGYGYPLLSTAPWSGRWNGDSDMAWRVKKVVIANGITSIGIDAFYHCVNLTSVTIPSSVTSIEDGAFSGCENLEDVTIPNSVTSINNNVFENCGLTSVTIPNSVTSIGDDAFSGCSMLARISVPDSVNEIGMSAFSGTEWYEAQPYGLVYIGRVAYKYKYESDALFGGTLPYDTKVTIKAGTIGIASGAFMDCSGMTSVAIPNSVTTIGSQAFYRCYNLKSITIPNSVTNIGSWAFTMCYSLKSITIPNNVSIIKWGTFSQCTGLNTVEIPNSVTSIDSQAFFGCTCLASVTIPDSVTSIGSEAFSDCTSLTSVIIPNSVTSIWYNSFNNTAWYNTQPDGLVYAGSVAYGYKGNMPDNTAINIEKGTLGIAVNAFYRCSEITSVTIPDSVTCIEGSAFQSCSGLTNIAIPDSVVYLGSFVFADCRRLTKVKIGNGVTRIEPFMFSKCSELTSVTIPNSMNSIEIGAFFDCSELKDIFYAGTVEQWKLIDIDYEDNNYLKKATIHFNNTTPETPSNPGNPEVSTDPGTPVTPINPDIPTEEPDAKVRLVYDFNGGILESDSTMGRITVGITDNKPIILQSFLITKTGYVFGGWGRTAEAQTGFAAGTEYSVTENTTLYAIWLRDTDGDGFADTWEKNGMDTDGDGYSDISLKAMGADPNIPDIFVQVDWMVIPAVKFGITWKKEKSLKPSASAMEMVYNAFNAHGINIHIDCGPDSIDYANGRKSWGTMGSGSEVEYTKVFDCGNYYLGDENFSNWITFANQNFSESRRKIFHHCIFANSFQYRHMDTEGNIITEKGNSGLSAGVPAQYFMIAAGEDDYIEGKEFTKLIDLGDIAVAGTFMHELGHNLGLGHGGNLNANFNPNHISIMNYSFQLLGLKTTNGRNYIDYSNFQLDDLNETALNENTGVNSAGLLTGTGLMTTWKTKKKRFEFVSAEGAIDFNEDGKIQDSVRYELNGNEINDPADRSCRTTAVELANDFVFLRGFNDWAYLVDESGAKSVYCGPTITDPINYSNATLSTGVSAEGLDELTFEEAIKDGILATPGTVNIETKCDTYFAHTFAQKLFLELVNYGATDLDVNISVSGSAVKNGKADGVYSVKGTYGVVGSVSIPIILSDNLLPGSYNLSCKITGSDIKEIKKTITINIVAITEEIKEAIINIDNDDIEEMAVISSEVIEQAKQIAETIDTEKESVPGDVDNDGSVTAADARLALRGAVGLEAYAPGSAEFTAADVDKSGDLTAADARLILRAAVGLEELK